MPATPSTVMSNGLTEAPRPVLHLSGQKLRASLEALVAGCEEQGGIERYIDALKLKTRVFQQALHDRDLNTLERGELAALCAFMPTVRRRVANEFDREGLDRLRHAIDLLLAGSDNGGTADDRLQAFIAQYPSGREYRWVKDLAAELLHQYDIERYPLMCRWVWDTKANTGALREIWHGDDVDSRTLDVADDYAMHLMLREELSVYLSENGFYRDIAQVVDLLLAQIYAEYICAQGGTYLRTDFSSPEDPMQHTRRMLGLDGIKSGSSKLRLKTVDGEAFEVD